MHLGRWKRKVIHAGGILLIFCGFYTLLFLPRICYGAANIHGDVLAYYLPVFYAPKTLWTNLLHSGFPSFADPQFQLWYPINRLFALLPNTWESFTIAAYVLASSFAYGYMYYLTKSRLAAVTSSFVYGMCGFMMIYWGYSTILHTAAWLPLLIWALDQLRTKLSAFWLAAGSAAFTGTWLAGHPQIAVYSFALTTAYALIFGYRAPIGRWRYYQAYGLMVTLALGLATIQLLPTLEFAQLSVRAKMSFEEFTSYSLVFRELVQLVFPHYLPPQSDGQGTFGYVGLLMPILIGVGGFSTPNRGDAKFWLVVVILSLLLALGGETPLGHIMYYVPVYNKFRAPVRTLLIASFAISVLVGLGISAFEQNRVSPRLFRYSALSSLAVVVTSFAMAIHWGGAEHSGRMLALPIGLWSIGSAVLIWHQKSRSKHQKQRLLLLVVLIIMVDLISFNWLDRRYPSGFSWLGHQTMAANHREYLVPSEAVTRYKQQLTETHYRFLPIRGVIATYQESSLDDIPPNTSLFWGVPSASGYGPLILSRYQQLLGIDAYGTVPTSSLAAANRAVDILSIKYIFANPLPEMPRWRRQEDISLSTIVYENQQVLPRTWLVSETITLNPAQILTAIQTSRLPDGRVYDPKQMALVETQEAQFQATALQPNDQAKILDMTDTRTRIQTQTLAPQFLVLSDVFYPGWVATIDGRRTEMFQTNYVQRGVKVPAGQHVIEFRFEPTSFRLGVGITVASFFAGTYWLSRQQRRS